MKKLNISKETIGEILERINHKHIVERAKREGVSTEGSDVEILERINRKHLERYK